jgi:hypothetical protein
MNQLISSISSFIQTVLATALIASGVLLFAGEVRLAALKKASQGSSKLTSFTHRMTYNNSNDLKKRSALIKSNQD